MATEPRHIFISYSHDSDDHKRLVRELADRLIQQGLAVSLDQYQFPPPVQGWDVWSEQQARKADYVLVICTAEYCRRFDDEAPVGTGRGVRAEAQIIRQILYDANQHNEKFIAVLLEGADENCVPLRLKPHARYRLNAEYEDLYRHLTRQPRFVPPAPGLILPLPPENAPVTPEPPGFTGSRRLTGPDDPLLQPARGCFLGRTEDVERVLQFLRSNQTGSQVVAAQVTGTGGIGKTEVCKAALKAWLAQEPPPAAWFVSLAGTNSAADVIATLGGALGRPEISGEAELLPLLQANPGLYYLDNLESVVDDPAARQLLQRIRNQVRGVRLLASSRVDFGALGRPIRLEVLPDEAAVDLFRNTWAEAAGERPGDSPRLRAFVGAQVPERQPLRWHLGCHPLAIVLAAVHGAYWNLEELIARWEKEGTALLNDPYGSGDRQESIEISLGLTARALHAYPGALRLWGLAALFPDGMGEAAWNWFQANGGISAEERERLQRHNVLNRRTGRLLVLPPVARYALERGRREQDGFSLTATLETAKGYFQTLAGEADRHSFDSQHIPTMERLLAKFTAVHRYVQIATTVAVPDVVGLAELNSNLV